MPLGGWGEEKNESVQGMMGREKRRREASVASLFPSPPVHSLFFHISFSIMGMRGMEEFWSV